MNELIVFEFNILKDIFTLISRYWFLGTFITAPVIVLVLSTLLKFLFKDR